MHLPSIACIDLGLILLIVEEGEHLCVLLFEALDLLQVTLYVSTHGFFFLLYLFELLLRPLPLGAALH